MLKRREIVFNGLASALISPLLGGCPSAEIGASKWDLNPFMNTKRLILTKIILMLKYKKN